MDAATILEQSDEDLRRLALQARPCIFATMGAAKYEEKAELSHTYGDAVSTKSTEEELAQNCERLYVKLRRVYGDYPLVICSHIPLEYWTKQTYETSFFYFMGHTHEHRCEAERHIFADNQLGHRAERIKLNAVIIQK